MTNHQHITLSGSRPPRANYLILNNVLNTGSEIGVEREPYIFGSATLTTLIGVGSGHEDEPEQTEDSSDRSGRSVTPSEKPFHFILINNRSKFSVTDFTSNTRLYRKERFGHNKIQLKVIQEKQEVVD